MTTQEKITVVRGNPLSEIVKFDDYHDFNIIPYYKYLSKRLVRASINPHLYDDRDVV